MRCLHRQRLLRVAGAACRSASLTTSSAAPAAAVSASSPLAASLRQAIEIRGPISVATFMRQALTHPEYGYYTAARRARRAAIFGQRGDFTTAPEISQMFGEMIAVWLIFVWQQLGSPKAVRLVEMGPGQGTLMADVLRVRRHRRHYRRRRPPPMSPL